MDENRSQNCCKRDTTEGRPIGDRTCSGVVEGREGRGSYEEEELHRNREEEHFASDFRHLAFESQNRLEDDGMDGWQASAGLKDEQDNRHEEVQPLEEGKSLFGASKDHTCCEKATPAGADDEHQGLALCKSSEVPHAMIAVRHDGGHERIGQTLGDSLNDEGYVELSRPQGRIVRGRVGMQEAHEFFFTTCA